MCLAMARPRHQILLRKYRARFGVAGCLAVRRGDFLGESDPTASEHLGKAQMRDVDRATRGEGGLPGSGTDRLPGRESAYWG